jgi:hypothetical protein
VRQLHVPAPAAEKPDESVDAGEITVARRAPNGAAGKNSDDGVSGSIAQADETKEGASKEEKPSAELLAMLGEPGVVMSQDPDGHRVD